MTAPIYRDHRGRFVSLPIEARAKLAAMGAKPPMPTLRKRAPKAVPWADQMVVDTANLLRARAGMPPTLRLGKDGKIYCDAIYRPVRKSWLERALTWFTWNRSRA